MLVSIFTNGTTITPEIAAHLADWLPSSVEITLYGDTQATYEQVTGVPGSFARCIRGIELLLAQNIPLSLKSTVTTANKDALPGMKRLAESYGVKFRFDAVLNLRFDGGQHPASMRISPEDVVVLDSDDARRKLAWQDMFASLRGATSRPNDLYQCGAGINTFHIDAFGKLSVCMMVRQHSYDLRTGSFQEGWQQFLGHVRMQQRTRSSACQHCELMALCSQCPGFSFVETGDEEQHIDYLCQITHLREKAFGTA
jgi:radical SAM protein with 4Fe4S-binding SPASM domain